MKKYAPEQLRDIAVIAHGGAGKTTLTEAMLYLSGGTDRFGRVEDGTATTDFDDDEKKRKISISMAFAPVEWKGTKINIIDTPGFLDFVGEVHAGLRIADGAIVMIDAVSGVEVGTEIVWRIADERHVPRIIAISRMDRENANFKQSLASVTEAFGPKACPVALPIGSGENFKGIVDIIANKAYMFADHSGKTMSEAPIPAELASEVEDYRGKLMEFAAETDEELLGKYLETMELDQEEFEKGLVA
ncbi:MAG TPA: GTP-binding protein, partial [Bacillota bacterium]|nr:GTP-binding protein [Bacillota bacterium]